MLDGVAWAAGEIVVFMLIATLIGFAIGWIFGRWLQRSSVDVDSKAEVAEYRDKAKRAEDRLSDSNEDLSKVNLELKGAQTKVVDLTAELETASAAAGDLAVESEAGATKDAEIERLTAELGAKADLESQLATLRGDLESCGAERDGLTGRVSELEDEVAASSSDLESCGAERDGLTGRVSELEDEVAASSSEKARLADRVIQLEEAAAARDVEIASIAPDVTVDPEPVEAEEPVVPIATVADVSDVEPSKEEGLARMAEIAQRTAGDGPAADDDLKKIHGIGPKLERTLKDLGITSFRQIANFQAEDVALVTAALDAFKGRIERDDWMSSAAEQHTMEYNEPADF